MRFKVFLYGSCLLVVIALLRIPLPAFACEPNDADPTRCANWRTPRALPTVPKVAVAPKPTAVPAVVAVNRGAGPHDALDISDAWQTLDPGASIWYKIGSGINRQRLEVWLDAWGKSGIAFAAYSPEQMGDWSPATPAKGRGTPNRADARHDLWWVGQAPAGGTWYVLVTNINPVPVSYRLGYNRTETEQKDCTEPYFEHINGVGVIWPGLCK
ncbi:MAG: hypothetical protein HY782_02900 [Chloroflexi bacterium]|nr:hypothetical protein [Chloroflexota bacterium]